MRNIELIKQPSGNSCGPTCLMMIWVMNNNHIDSNNKPPTIQSICEMCGTDWVVGTPPDRMVKGMDALKIKYVEYIHSPRPYELLKNVIDSGNIGLLRTITKGVPHWIIVLSYLIDSKTGFVIYGVLDPWQGEIQYTEKELDAVWKLRQYQFFEIIPHQFKNRVNPETGEIILRYNPIYIEQDYYLTIRNDENTTRDTTE